MKKTIFRISLILSMGAIFFYSCSKDEDTTDNQNEKLTDQDGNKYKTVVIGNQTWMAENLKATHYTDGTTIPHITDNTEWKNLEDNNTDKAYCFYNNDESLGYGILYTYAAATNGDNSGSNVQGICPDGWHLPSDDEWTELTNYLGGLDVAGGKMKETGTTHWASPNEGATNESGFSALPGGNRGSYYGSFDDVSNQGFWWSSTESSSDGAQVRNLYYGSTHITRYYYGLAKSSGLSVRCLKD